MVQGRATQTQPVAGPEGAKNPIREGRGPEFGAGARLGTGTLRTGARLG